jgi:ribosomal protein L25 (general stress protein Ctc)
MVLELAMSQELITIEGKVRSAIGTAAVRKVRKSGMLPGNLQDKGKSTPIEINPKLLNKVCKAGNTFELTLDGSPSRRVKIQELQVDPIRREPVHIDLVYS